MFVFLNLVCIAALVGIDQAIKLWAVQNLMPVESMPLIPHIVELRFVYKLLRAKGGSQVHIHLFYLAAAAERMNYCKYRLILDIFQELKLAEIPADLSSVRLLETGKVDLESSQILTGLRSLLKP